MAGVCGALARVSGDMLLGVAALLTSRSTFPVMCQVRTHIDAADRASNEAAADAYGESTAHYEASEISPSQIDHLISRGYVVLDGVFDAEEAAGLELCLQLLDDSDSLAAEPDGSGRDDSIRFVDESSAMLSIEAALHPLHPLCTLSAPDAPDGPSAICAPCALCDLRSLRPALHLCTPSARLRALCARATLALHLRQRFVGSRATGRACRCPSRPRAPRTAPTPRGPPRGHQRPARRAARRWSGSSHVSPRRTAGAF